MVPLTREEEGVGVLTGAYLGGRRGLLMMQVSGLGNSMNGLASLAIPYQIPFLMLISQRGELGEFNPAQIAMGRAARPVLDALDIQHFTLHRVDEVATLMDGAIKTVYAAQRPTEISQCSAINCRAKGLNLCRNAQSSNTSEAQSTNPKLSKKSPKNNTSKQVKVWYNDISKW